MKEFKKENTCSFTGNRPQKLPWGNDENSEECVKAKQFIVDEIEKSIQNGITHFICGMAQGGDMYFGEAVASLKNKYDYITLEAAIPCNAQTKGWSEEYLVRYNNILNMCDKKTVISECYTNICMHIRNRYMVDNCCKLITLNTQDRGGTVSTIKYAKQRKDVEVVSVVF